MGATRTRERSPSRRRRTSHDSARPLNCGVRRMPTDIALLVRKLDAITNVTDEAQLRNLNQLVDSFFAHPRAAEHLDVWFRFLERFPEDDGFEVFWSILHALEKQAGCDLGVLRSVQRKPSRFPVLMVNRMLNAGIRRVAGVELLDLLRAVATDTNVIPSVSEDAKKFLRHASA